MLVVLGEHVKSLPTQLLVGVIREYLGGVGNLVLTNEFISDCKKLQSQGTQLLVPSASGVLTPSIAHSVLMSEFTRRVLDSVDSGKIDIKLI